MEDEIFFEKLLTVAKSAAIAAGNIIKMEFGRPKTLQTKTCNVDIVTDVDKKCQETIISIISKNFNNHKFYAEESEVESQKISSDPTWIIDPIDGTTNFIHGFPWVCVSIAVMINHRIVVGVIHAPILNEMFTSIINKGSYLNDNRIHVSNSKSLSNSIIDMEVGYDRSDSGNRELSTILSRLLKSGIRSIRALGSCALNMASVACGRLDGYFEGKNSSNGIHPWDISAGILIVKEAGGVVCDTCYESNDVSAGKLLDLDLYCGRILCSCSTDIAHELLSYGIDRRYIL